MGQCQSCQKSVPAGSFPPSHVHVTTLQSNHHKDSSTNSVRRIHYPYSPPSTTSKNSINNKKNSLVVVTTTSSTVPHDEQQADAQQQQQDPRNLRSPFSTDSTANLSHWTASPPLPTAAVAVNIQEEEVVVVVEEEVPSDEEELEEQQEQEYPPALSSTKSIASLQTWNASNPPPNKQAVHPQALDAFAVLKHQVEQQQQQQQCRPTEPSSCLTHTLIQPTITTTSTNNNNNNSTHKLPGSFVTVRHHDDDAHSLVSDLGDEASWSNQSWGRGAFRKNNDYGVQRRTNDTAYANKNDHHQQVDPRFSAALQVNLGISWNNNHNETSVLTARLDRIEEALAATATPCKQDTDNSTQATPIIHNTTTKYHHLDSTLGKTYDDNDTQVWESPTNGTYYPTTTRGHDESPDDELTPLKPLSKQQQHEESFQSSFSDTEASQSADNSSNNSDQLETMQVNVSTTSDPMHLPSLSLTPLLFAATSAAAASETQVHAANISSESDDSSDQLASIVQNNDDSMSAHYTSPYAFQSFNNHIASVNVSMGSTGESSNASATGTSDPDTSQRSTVSLPMDVLNDEEQDERSCWTAPMRQASPIIQPGNTARRARMLEANNRRADDTPGAPLRSKSFMELRSWAQSSTPASPSSSCASSVVLDQSPPETAADDSNQSLSLDIGASRQYSPPRPLYPRGQERHVVRNNTPSTSTTTVVPAPRTEPSRYSARLDAPHDGTTTTPLHTLPLRSQSWSTTAKRHPQLLLRGHDLESARKSLLLADRVEAQVKEVLTKYRNEKQSPVGLP